MPGFQAAGGGSEPALPPSTNAFGAPSLLATRRNFLASCTSMGALALGRWVRRKREPRRNEVPAGSAVPPQAFLPAKSVIWLWMGGGQSQTDTWDPKPGQGPFQAIESAVAGIRVSELLPRCAGLMKHLAIVRSMDTRETLPELANWLMHVGFYRIQDTLYPPIGTILASELGGKDFPLPKYIAMNPPTIPQDGFLDDSCRPFQIDSLDSPLRDAHRAVDDQRGRDREALLDEECREWEQKRRQRESRAQHESARRAQLMMDSPLFKAFDIREESEASRQEYGPGFGQWCLLARRLVEAGCPFIEIGLPGWDAKDDHFSQVKRLAGELDAGMGTLVTDLDRRGLLDQTLIVCLGPYGRSASVVDGRWRERHGRGWSIVLAGGPILGGQVIGETGPDGATCVHPISAAMLFSTIYRACGIDPNKRIGIGYCVDSYTYPPNLGIPELLPH